jgi:hypothetical protein
MNHYDEIRLAELLAVLPPAPEAWVAAAKELPFAKAAMDDLIVRAEADAAFRSAVLADLERAIADAGHEPTPALVRELHRRLAGGS